MYGGRKISKVLYYVWKDGDRIGFDNGYETIEEAIQDAMENNADEIEETTWNSTKSYNNYEPADNFKIVWRK